ncbi:MAG: PAS domain S-box protein [Spirochaetes bacterium]|nr:PAS domain S-box protein [Spirochaetota bacterium]
MNAARIKRSVLLVGILCAAVTFAAVESPREILILHSYHKSDWTDAIMSGIDSVLRTIPGIIVQVEYMDTKKAGSKEYLELLRRSYEIKYRNNRFALIITSDNDALAFVIEHHAYIFNNAPVIFCGVNAYTPALLQGDTNVTGVVEYGDFIETLSLAFKARPAASNVYAVCDATKTSIINRDEFIPAVRTVRPDARITILEQYTLDELAAFLRTAPPDDVVFFIGFWKDRSGRNIAPAELGSAFKTSAAPVFGRSEWMVGSGMTGGKCVTGFHQGEEAAIMARKLLAGTPLSALPVNTNSPNKFMFDYHELTRHRIPHSILPRGSIIIGGPKTFYEVWKPVLIALVAALTAAMILLIMLMVSVVKRRRATHALFESEQKYRELFDSESDAIFLVDNGTGRILEANKAAGTLYGYPRETLIGMQYETLSGMAPDHHEGRHSRAWMPESIHRRHDGSVFSVEITGSVFIFGGREVRIVAVRDITQRKQAEEDSMRYLAEVERSNRELAEFAYAASHDLQEPLRKVQAFGDRLLTRFAADMHVEAKDYIERMMRSTERMQDLIKDLLLYSRINTAGLPFSSVDLATVIDEIAELFETQLMETGGRIIRGTMPVLEADRIQMLQLFQNLVSNAIKFRCAERPLEITVSSAVTGGIVTIDVRDNGIGFEQQYVDKIFTIFQRLHSRERYEGTGIGLAICKRIIERHGGTINAWGMPGEGTLMRMVLPVRHGGA